MRCYLIRHAQTTWNAEDRIQGHANPPLSTAGRLQARRVGRYFAGRPIQALYTSHLVRSVHTAQAIAQQTGTALTVEPALAEIHLGEWEGLTVGEVEGRYPEAFRRWQRTPSQMQIPGGESFAAFAGRVRHAFAAILQRSSQEGDVVVVSHGGAIASLLTDHLGADYDTLFHRLSLENAGISALDCLTRPPRVLWVNATQHLAPRQRRSLARTRALTPS